MHNPSKQVPSIMEIGKFEPFPGDGNLSDMFFFLFICIALSKFSVMNKYLLYNEKKI